MKSVKRFARMMALAVAVCMLLAVGVFASENGNIWVSASSEEGRTTAVVETDCTVTDGSIVLTYDAEALTYRGVEVNEDYVAMYSVNADEAGRVCIAWVAPGEVKIDQAAGLILVNFTGTSDEALGLGGTVTGAEITNAPEEGGEATESTESTDPTEATKPEDGKGESGGSTGGNGSTGTGDNSNLTAAIVLALVCVAGVAAVCVVLFKGKKGGKA